MKSFNSFTALCDAFNRSFTSSAIFTTQRVARTATIAIPMNAKIWASNAVTIAMITTHKKVVICPVHR